MRGYGWRGRAIGARCVSDSALSSQSQKRNKTMKLTKNDIKQKRAELVEVLLKTVAKPVVEAA